MYRRIDALHLPCPFAGSQVLRDLLRQADAGVGRLHVAALMRRTARLKTARYRGPWPPAPSVGTEQIARKDLLGDVAELVGVAIGDDDVRHILELFHIAHDP